MCFYLQQHLLNKEKEKPSPSCSASWGTAGLLLTHPDRSVGGLLSAPLVQVRLLLGWGSGCKHSVVAGFAGLEAGMFPGIHVQSDLVAGAEDPGSCGEGI